MHMLACGMHLSCQMMLHFRGEKIPSRTYVLCFSLELGKGMKPSEFLNRSPTNRGRWDKRTNGGEEKDEDSYGLCLANPPTKEVVVICLLFSLKNEAPESAASGNGFFVARL